MIGVQKKRNGKDLIKDYRPFFSDQWRIKGTKLWRRVGDWVEVINLSLRDLSIGYIFEHGFIYLNDDSGLSLSGDLCLEELRSPLFFQRHDPLRLTSGTQWFVYVKDHEKILEEVFREMNKSFRPGMLVSFDDYDMLRLLESGFLPFHDHTVLIMGIIALTHDDLPEAQKALGRLEAMNARITDERTMLYSPEEPPEVRSLQRVLSFFDIYNENHNKFLEEMARIRSANIKKLNWPGLVE